MSCLEGPTYNYYNRFNEIYSQYNKHMAFYKDQRNVYVGISFFRN